MPTKLAICLYEDTIDSLDVSELICGKPLEKLSVNTKDSDTLFYLKETNTNTPEWVDIVKSFADLKGHNTETASSGGILFLKIKGRIIACCFGSSVGNINRENLVGDFGLAAAFQRIKKDDFKTIESYTLSINPITNNRSSAITTTQNNFNIDNYLENITELSGKSLEKIGKVIVKGKQFYSTPSPLNLTDIKMLCESLLDNYELSINDDDYKRLTATKKVKVKAQIEFLEKTLCEKLNKRLSEIHLLDFETSQNIDSYSFGLRGKKHTEISIQDFYNDLKNGFIINLPYLKKTKQIITYDSDGNQLVNWSVYKCLFCFIDANFGKFILFKGHWYEIEERYLNDLKAFIKTYEFNSSSMHLPDWDGVCNEGDYNILAATAVNGQCWDKVLYTHKDYSYGIEFCDVLTMDSIIHVKKYTCSALNSHLLLQTAVSASLLKSDSLLKKWIKKESQKRFAKNIFLKSNGELKNPNAEYIILLLSTSIKSVSEMLPFFSLVSFNLIIKKLVQLGYTVRIAKA